MTASTSSKRKPSNVHLAHHDVTFVAVSRTPLSQTESFKNRMGWRFKWASSYGSDFDYDFHVSATKDELAKGRMYYNYEMVEFQCEEQPGISVFYKARRRHFNRHVQLPRPYPPRSPRGEGPGYGTTTERLRQRRKGGLSDSQSYSPIASLALPLPT